MVNKIVSELMKELMKQLMKLWKVWDIEGCIICSLMLQVFLVFAASRRKQNSKELKFIRPLIWLAYLVADAVAIYSLGLISNGIGDTRKIKKDKDLLAFWAPFLLLHLGGPDTITAFSLEDNELWLRNALKVVVQVVTTGYILSRSFTGNPLLIPTLLMLVVGAIRYVERIRALYLASDDGFKSLIPKTPDPGTKYLKLIHEYTLNKEAGIPTSIEIPSEHSRMVSINGREEEVESVKIAREFFEKFKRIIADLLLRFNETNESRDYLLKYTANRAFQLMDIELEFAYDILYTKGAVVHTRIGYITRTVCFSSILIAFLYFSLFFDYHNKIHDTDIILTYGLLCGALALDLVSLVQLIFSNWTSIFLYDYPFLKSIIRRFAFKGKRAMIISQFNLIDSCFFNHKHLKFLEKNPWPSLTYKALNIFKHTKYDVVSHKLKDFIFKELTKKTKEAINVKSSKNLCSSRGRWALQNRGCYDELEWSVNVEFEESILLWHIATDLCLKHDDGKHDDDKEENDDEHDKIAIPILVSERRHVSKLLSEYLLYLLVRHPKMISSIEGMRQIKYTDAYEEVMSVFKTEDIEENEPGVGGSLKALEKLLLLSKKVMSVFKSEDIEENKPGVGGSLKAREKLLFLSKQMPEKSNLVLFDACFLAKKLNEMSLTRKWEIISEVLVELLSFAASQCRGNYHAQALGRGGELITHVWFLMAHLGLGQIFHVASSHSKAKVTVRK